MKILKSCCLIIATISTMQIAAQHSGSGQITYRSVGTSGCEDPVCNVRTNQEDRYLFVIPASGAVTFTATLGSDMFTCCDLEWVYTHSVRLMGALTWEDFNGPGTYTGGIDCLEEGDSISLLFFGSGGAYSFTLDFIPEAICDDEDNDSPAEATPILDFNQTITGCLRYYKGLSSSVDSEDYYSLGAFGAGDQAAFDLREIGGRVRYCMFRDGSPNTLACWEAPATPTYTFPENDQYYIRAESFWPASCVQYEMDITAIPRKEYEVSASSIQLSHDPDDDLLFITGDFSGKSIEITDVTNAVVQDLSAMSSPILFDVTTLSPGQHFLVIRDQTSGELELQDLIRE